MRRFYFSFLLLFLGISSSLWAGNFNFPQNKDYPYGQRVTSATAGADIQSIYTAWKNQFYVEGTKNGVAMARIKFTDASHGSPNGEHTVSEGIGYGMLIFVYMENATNSTQDEFNKLWAYYQAFDNNSNGLMEWETNGFSDVYRQGAATDGDLDVATALLLADKQWGSSGSVNYVNAAKTLLNNIFSKEVNGDFLKPGDAWDDVKNPCYFTLAAFRLFDKAQTQYGFAGADNHNWKAVFEKSNSYLNSVQANSSAGLYPDWSNSSGGNSNNSAYKYEYGMDACRTPWRVVWDYLWYGTYTSTPNSQTLSQKTATWVNANAATPSSTGDKYNLDGSKTGSWNNAAYMGGFGSSLMIDPKYSSLLTTYYNATRDFSTSEYYQKSLQILYTLLMSGNCPNFFDGSPVSGRISGATIPATATTIELTFSKALKTIVAGDKANFTVKVNGTATTISSLTPNTTDKTKATLTFATAFKATDIVTLSYTGTSVIDADNLAVPKVADYPVTNSVPANGLLISDCNDTIVATGGPWYSYNDASVKGASTVTPLSAKNKPFIMTDPGFKGAGDKCAKVSIALSKGGFAYDPFVGYGFKILQDSTPVGTSWATATGIEFYHKGVACVISPFMSNFYTLDPSNKPTTTVSDNQWYQDIPAHADWTLVKITFDKTTGTGLKLPSWFSAAQIAAAPAIDPTKFFKIQWQVQSAVVGFTGDLYLDELTIAGVTPKAADKTALVAALASAKTTLDAAVTGEGDGQYPVAAYNTLSTARSTASTVNADTKATQATVDAQTKALTDAIAAFKLTVITVTKTALLSSISAANSVKTAAVVGEGNGQYRQASKDTLGFAIDAAQAIYDAAGSSQAAVDKAKSDLDAAVVKFQSLAYKVSKLVLTAAVADATTAANAAVAGTAVGNFPQAAITAYKAAIATADGVNKASGSIQSAIDKAVADLKTATDAFIATKVTAIAVDTKPLVDAVAAANVLKNAAVAGEGDGQYPSTAIAAYASAITIADGVVTTATTQAQITDAVNALETATTTFTATKFTVSKVALKDSITKASASITNLVGGNGNGQYPQTAIDTYTAAIATAQAVYDNKNASKSIVEAAVNTLDAATKAFKKSITVVDYTALKAKVSAVTTLLGLVSVGDGNGQYPAAAKTALVNAQSTASTVASNTSATQKQVDDALAALTTAITTFNNSVVVVDYSGLTTGLTAAKNTLKDASIGNGNGQYPTSAQTDLQTAISTADAVAKNTIATQAQVTAAKDALAAAVVTFNGTIITVSLTGLDAVITTASDLKKAAVIGSADGQYTTTVVADFTTAISAATTVQGTAHVTKAAVDQAIADLNAAIDLFKKSANTSAATDFSALTTAITAANTAANVTVGTNPCEYPSAAASTFAAAIKVAQDMVTAGTAKQGEVNSQITTLNSAKSIFLASKIAEASKTALNKAISDASATFTGKVIGNNPGQYPAADSIKLKQAIIAAQSVAANTCATVSQVSTSTTSVTDAIAAFLAAKVKEASKTDLATAIATADPKAATPASSIGSNPGQYSQASFSALTTALSAAKTVYANAVATPAEVLKATQDLNTAITAFDNSKIGAVDKTALNNIIAKAKAFKDSTISKIGLNPGQYPSVVVSALNTKYDAAYAVSNTASSLQPAIDAATEGLTTAYETAVASRVAPLDKTELATAISAASAKVPSASQIGTAVGQYQQALVTTLTDAIAAGNTVKGTLLATSTQIATAIANLRSAVAGLVANTTSGGGGTVVTLDKKALTDDTTKAVSLLKATNNNLGTLPTQYNAAADKITTLRTSLAEARSALAGTSQTLIDLAAQALEIAINDVAATLVASPDKSALNQALVSAQTIIDLTPNRYPSAAIETFANVIKTANLVYANKTATKAEVDAALASLAAAKTALFATKVDADALGSAIESANKLMLTVGSLVGNVPTVSYTKEDSTTLSRAIVAAQSVYNNAAATQVEVTAAAQALNLAASKIKPILAADTKLVVEAKLYAHQALKNATIGTKPGNYPFATFSTLDSLVSIAEANNFPGTATQAEVNKLASDINAARIAFITSKIPATTANTEVEATTVELVQNPVAQFVHLQAKNGTIVSVQILGLLTGGAEIEVNASDANIDVSDLASSCYFASVKLSNGKTKVLKFVK